MRVKRFVSRMVNVIEIRIGHGSFEWWFTWSTLRREKNGFRRGNEMCEYRRCSLDRGRAAALCSGQESGIDENSVLLWSSWWSSLPFARCGTRSISVLGARALIPRGARRLVGKKQKNEKNTSPCRAINRSVNTSDFTKDWEQ